MAKQNKNDDWNKPPQENKKKKKQHPLVLPAVLVTGVLVFGGAFYLQNEAKKDAAKQGSKLRWNEFVEQAKDDGFTGIVTDGQKVVGYTPPEQGGRYPWTVAPTEQKLDELIDIELDTGGSVERVLPPKEGTHWSTYASLGLMAGLVGLFYFSHRRQKQMMQGGGNNPMAGHTKSKARLFEPNENKTTFDDVAGADEAIEEVREVVDFLKNPAKFERLGAKIPSGVLMSGPPGTGKTLLAKAIAGEAHVPFFSTSGSEFTEMFVGVGAGRVRDMFAEAKKRAPCIIFIDEIDSMGGKRGANNHSGESETTLNQILTEMDGFEGDTGVIVIAATNRPDMLDDALMRPGRFDRQVGVGYPDEKGRKKMLEIHTRNKILGDDIDLDRMAKNTSGFSGAAIAQLCNEAAIFAVRRDAPKIEAEDFAEARDKVMMGAQRKSMVMSDKDKKNTAFHEAAHAIVGMHEDEHDDLEKVTILPRGRALGVTMFTPNENEQPSMEKLVSKMRTLVAGRFGEEVINGEYGVTPGASNDIEVATSIAKRMITEWGMDPEMGMVQYVKDGRYSTGSQETAAKIDEKTLKLIDDAVQHVKKIFEDPSNLEALEKLSDALLEHETLTKEEIDKLINITKIEDPYKKDKKGPIIDRSAKRTPVTPKA